MKKIFMLTFALGACSLLSAEAGFPEPGFPAGGFPAAEKAVAKVQKQAEKKKVSRKVPVVISAKGMSEVKAQGVLLRVNSDYTEAQILLNEKASRAIDIIGESDSDEALTPVSIYVDLSAFGKGFYSKNNNASKDLYASHQSGSAPLYVYTMKINPKGNFAKSIKNLTPISEDMARNILRKDLPRLEI